MINKGHPIDAFFTEELGNIEIVPPNSIWDTINQKLNQKRKVRLLWYKLGWAAGIALFVSISSTIFVQTNKNKTSDNSVSLILQKPSVVTHPNINSNNPATLKPNLTNTKATNAIIVVYVSKPESIHLETKVIRNENSSFVSSSLEPSISLIIGDSLHYLGLQNEMKSPNTSPLTNANLIKEPIIKDSLLVPIFGPEKGLALENIVSKTHRWSVEGQFAPTYAFRTNSAQNAPSGSNNNESGLIAWSAGMKLNFTLNRKLSVQMGLYYSLMGQVLNNIFRNTNSIINNADVNYTRNAIYIENSLGPISNDEPIANDQYTPESAALNNSYFTTKTNVGVDRDMVVSNSGKIDGRVIQKLHYIEIPLILRYRLFDRTFKWHILSGINTGILFNANALLQTSGSKEIIGKTTGLKPINYSVIAGFGFMVPIRKNIQLIVEPTFKYNINSLSNIYLKNTHLYSFNLYTGFCFNL